MLQGFPELLIFNSKTTVEGATSQSVDCSNFTGYPDNEVKLHMLIIRRSTTQLQNQTITVTGSR